MRKYKILILKIAKDDISEARKWYDKQKSGLSKKFIADMKMSLKAMSDNPSSFAIRYLDYRLANFKTFPYAAHFFIIEKESIVIITTFLHTSRYPDTNDQRLT